MLQLLVVSSVADKFEPENTPIEPIECMMAPSSDGRP